MSGQRAQVDLGLVALPVGEVLQSRQDFAQAGAADPTAVARFHAALGGARSDTRNGVQDEAQPGCSRFDTADAHEVDENEGDVGAEVEYIWFSLGSDATQRREVAAGLRRDVLEQTWVRLYESGGRLHVQFHAGTEASRTWIECRLENLARTLGERMKRTVRVSTLGSLQAADASRSCDWPEHFK